MRPRLIHIGNTGVALLFAIALVTLASAPMPARAAEDVNSLISVLRDSHANTETKGEACVKLMEMGPAAAPAVPALTHLLNSPDQLMRDYAVTTLEKIGPGARAALPALKFVAARDPSEDIRQLASEAIRSISEAGAAASEAPVAPASAAPAVPARSAAREASAPHPAAASASIAPRPVMRIRQGRYFRWAEPVEWSSNETTNGVDVTAPDGVTLASLVLLLRYPGAVSPGAFARASLTQLNPSIRFTSSHPMQPQSSAVPGAPWRLEEMDYVVTYRGKPLTGHVVCAAMSAYGQSSVVMGTLQAPTAQWKAASLWLPEITKSVTIINARQVAGNDTILPAQNHPLDNSVLIESWRQKGISEDRISKAREEATLGYERVQDPATGEHYDMPLESWDATRGGYVNFKRPTELFQRVGPGDQPVAPNE